MSPNPNDESVSSGRNPIDRGNWSDDRANQNSDPAQGKDPGKPWAKNQSNPIKQGDNDEPVHPAIDEDERVKASGRQVGGLPNPPLISVNPTSKPVRKAPKLETKVIHDIGDELVKNDYSGSYDTSELEINSGLFIPMAYGQTIDQLMLKVNAEVHKLNEYWSVFVRNDEGERILDVIMVEEIVRNDDKSIQLNADNAPVVRANQKFTPRRIQLRQYAATNVTAGDNFDEDGALIVRVF